MFILPNGFGVIAVRDRNSGRFTATSCYSMCKGAFAKRIFVRIRKERPRTRSDRSAIPSPFVRKIGNGVNRRKEFQNSRLGSYASSSSDSCGSVRIPKRNRQIARPGISRFPVLLMPFSETVKKGVVREFGCDVRGRVRPIVIRSLAIRLSRSVGKSSEIVSSIVSGAR